MRMPVQKEVIADSCHGVECLNKSEYYCQSHKDFRIGRKTLSCSMGEASPEEGKGRSTCNKFDVHILCTSTKTQGNCFRYNEKLQPKLSPSSNWEGQNFIEMIRLNIKE